LYGRVSDSALLNSGELSYGHPLWYGFVLVFVRFNYTEIFMMITFKNKNINAVILTGGKSSRMGVDKCLLKFGNATLLENTVTLLTPLFNELILSVGYDSSYPEFNYKKAVDVHKGLGPLIGIYSSLLVSETDQNFIVSCDMPFINKDLISFVVNYPTDKLIKIPVAENKIHPLCGVYSKRIVASLKNMIDDGMRESPGENLKNKKLSIKSFLDNLSVEYINVAENYTGYKPEMFFNINTMDDFEAAIKYSNKL
jgi:molybdopterin-guanine dinucleotide biosynthesis protein A